MTQGRESFTGRSAAWAAGFLLIVAAASMAVTMQGWRSRAPAFDLLPHIENAHRLVHAGVLPRHGDTGSYGSYKPPGTAWVMAPSVLLFADPRLSEYVGSAILHGIALVGLFWLGWWHFGAACAYLSVVLYAASEHGLFLAGSLWPNGRPDAYVALVAFTVLWAARRDSRFLALAVAAWGIGLYIDMAITPAFFIFPAVWLYERPPVRLMSLAVAAAVVVLVWSPYLRFEAPRRFIDIRSQLLQQDIFPVDHRRTWCDPSLVVHTLDDPTTPRAPDVAQPDRRALEAGLAVGRSLAENAVSNFNVVAPVTGGAALTFGLTLMGLVIAGLAGTAGGDGTPSACARRRRLTIIGGVAAATLAGLYAATSPTLVGHHAPGGAELAGARRLLRLAAMGCAAAVALPALADLGRRLLARSGARLSALDWAARTRVLRISLIVPWMILVLMAESGKPERFWWLWPLQVVFLSAFVVVMLPRLGVPPWLCGTLAVALIVLVAVNGTLVSRVRAWAAEGWAGSDAEEVQVVDALAAQIKGTGKDAAAIGYRIFIYPFMATYHVTNPRYKAGAELDFLLEARHGVRNTNQCAEGFGPADEFRVVQTRPKPPAWAPKSYFEVPSDGRFKPVADVARYRVFRAE